MAAREFRSKCHGRLIKSAGDVLLCHHILNALVNMDFPGENAVPSQERQDFFEVNSCEKVRACFLSLKNAIPGFSCLDKLVKSWSTRVTWHIKMNCKSSTTLCLIALFLSYVRSWFFIKWIWLSRTHTCVYGSHVMVRKAHVCACSIGRVNPYIRESVLFISMRRFTLWTLVNEYVHL